MSGNGEIQRESRLTNTQPTANFTAIEAHANIEVAIRFVLDSNMVAPPVERIAVGLLDKYNVPVPVVGNTECLRRLQSCFAATRNKFDCRLTDVS